MKYNKLILRTVAVLVVIGVLGYIAIQNVNTDSRDHDHPVKDEIGNEESDQSLRIPVTQEQVTRLGIRISRATQGIIRREIRAPGDRKSF